MGPGLQTAIDRVRAAAARGRDVVLGLAASVGGRWLLIGGTSALVVLAGGAWALLSGAAPGPSDSAATGYQPPAYVVVCAHCGHRAPAASTAKPRTVERLGMLRCAVCDRAAATVYRRGSQSIPPGGWSSGSPRASRAGDVGAPGDSP